MPSDDRLDSKRAEIFEKLMSDPSEAELRRLQAQLDALEKWKILGENGTVTRGDDDTDHSNENKHEHDHHS
jgi:hypothetical protein